MLETPDEAIPIEVKATESPSLADASHLKLFLETYPQTGAAGFHRLSVSRAQASGGQYRSDSLVEPVEPSNKDPFRPSLSDGIKDDSTKAYWRTGLLRTWLQWPGQYPPWH